MKKVVVLLSSYNGEKYLEEQIESLLKQDDVEVSIIVRDDGSNDRTIQILEEYANYGKLQIIRGENIGWKKSFIELLCKSPDADYYAFCDQDDIWLPNKLKIAIDKLEAMPIDEPNLYASNLRFYKDGVDKGLVRNCDVNISLHSALVANLTAGCTMVFNKNLRDLIRTNPPQIDFPHDYWIYLVSALLGNVYYDKNAYILYRQHGENQIGTTISVISLWKNRIENIRDIFRPHGRQKAASELLRIYRNTMTIEKVLVVEKVAFYNRSFKNKLSLIFDKKYSMGSWDSNIGLRLRILLGGL